MAIISKKLSTKRSSRKVSKRSSRKVSTKRSSRKVSTKRSSRKAHKGGTIKGWGLIRNKNLPRRRLVSSYPSIYGDIITSLRKLYEKAKREQKSATQLGKHDEAQEHRLAKQNTKKKIKFLTERERRGTTTGNRFKQEYRKYGKIRRQASTNLEKLFQLESSLNVFKAAAPDKVNITKNNIAMLKQTMIEDLMKKFKIKKINKSTKKDIKKLSSNNMKELIYSNNLTKESIEQKIDKARKRAQKKAQKIGDLINKGSKAFNDNIYKQIFQETMKKKLSSKNTSSKNTSSKTTSYNTLVELSLKEYLQQFKNNILSNSNLNNIVNTVRQNKKERKEKLFNDLNSENKLLRKIQSREKKNESIFNTDKDYQSMLDILKRLTDFDDTRKYKEQTDPQILDFVINLKDYIEISGEKNEKTVKIIDEAKKIINKIEKAKEYKEAAAERAESERKAAEQAAAEQAAAEKAAAEEARIAAEEARIAAEEARIAAEKAAAEKEAAERVTAEQESEQYSGFEGLNILY